MEYFAKVPARQNRTADGYSWTRYTRDVEGAAFAWLAKQFVEIAWGNLPPRLRVRKEENSGALYPH